jgi:hypothetical protein
LGKEKPNGMGRSPITSTRTRLTLSLGVACRRGEDEIRKQVIDYKKERSKMHLRRE